MMFIYAVTALFNGKFAIKNMLIINKAFLEENIA